MRLARGTDALREDDRSSLWEHYVLNERLDRPLTRRFGELEVRVAELERLAEALLT